MSSYLMGAIVGALIAMTAVTMLFAWLLGLITKGQSYRVRMLIGLGVACVAAPILYGFGSGGSMSALYDGMLIYWPAGAVIAVVLLVTTK